jgi:hypothetical protein
LKSKITQAPFHEASMINLITLLTFTSVRTTRLSPQVPTRRALMTKMGELIPKMTIRQKRIEMEKAKVAALAQHQLVTSGGGGGGGGGKKKSGGKR